MMSTNVQVIFDDIKHLVSQGKNMEVFEKYYSDDVLMQDNENPPTVGKEANRQRHLAFLANLIELHCAEVKTVAFGEDLIISEWFTDLTHQEFGRITRHHVSVQHWQDGRVIDERYYYGA
jgi:hypothetical protein